MVRKNNGEIENFKVDVDLFGMTVDVCLGSYDDTKQYIKDEYNVDVDPEIHFVNTDGVLIDLEKDYKVCCSIVLAIKNFRDVLRDDLPYAVNLITHECLHAATTIMDNRGIPVNVENDEVIAYIQSYLVQKIMENLEEIGVKITLDEKR